MTHTSTFLKALECRGVLREFVDDRSAIVSQYTEAVLSRVAGQHRVMFLTGQREAVAGFIGGMSVEVDGDAKTVKGGDLIAEIVGRIIAEKVAEGVDEATLLASVGRLVVQGPKAFTNLPLHELPVGSDEDTMGAGFVVPAYAQAGKAYDIMHNALMVFDVPKTLMRSRSVDELKALIRTNCTFQHLSFVLNDREVKRVVEQHGGDVESIRDYLETEPGALAKVFVYIKNRGAMQALRGAAVTAQVGSFGGGEVDVPPVISGIKHIGDYDSKTDEPIHKYEVTPSAADADEMVRKIDGKVVLTQSEVAAMREREFSPFNIRADIQRHILSATSAEVDTSPAKVSAYIHVALKFIRTIDHAIYVRINQFASEDESSRVDGILRTAVYGAFDVLRTDMKSVVDVQYGEIGRGGVTATELTQKTEAMNKILSAVLKSVSFGYYGSHLSSLDTASNYTNQFVDQVGRSVRTYNSYKSVAVPAIRIKQMRLVALKMLAENRDIAYQKAVHKAMWSDVVKGIQDSLLAASAGVRDTSASVEGDEQDQLGDALLPKVDVNIVAAALRLGGVNSTSPGLFDRAKPVVPDGSDDVSYAYDEQWSSAEPVLVSIEEGSRYAYDELWAEQAEVVIEMQGGPGPDGGGIKPVEQDVQAVDTSTSGEFAYDEDFGEISAVDVVVEVKVQGKKQSVLSVEGDGGVETSDAVMGYEQLSALEAGDAVYAHDEDYEELGSGGGISLRIGG